MIDEAVGGVVPAATPSLVFRSLNDDDTQRKIFDLQQVRLIEPRPEGIDDEITKLFRAEEGVIRAVDPAAILKLAKGGDIVLAVTALDMAGTPIWDRIRFRFR